MSELGQSLVRYSFIVMDLHHPCRSPGALRSTPNNGHQQTGPVGPVGANFGRRGVAAGTKSSARALFCMADPIEEVLAPSVIERTMTIFESFKERGHCEIVQERKALTEHVFGLIASGETDEKRLVVAGLTYLKSLEGRTLKARS
jgi:hypothetical protein